MTLVLRPEREGQLQKACEYLLQGEVLALPTETVYGLAGLALSEKSLAKIFSLKNRPHFDPLIVHVLDLKMLKSLVDEVPLLERILIEKFWPGPLTILFKKKNLVPDLCTAGSSWLAARSPQHPVFREILKRIQAPLAAPSANRFGQISPTSFQDVLEELGPFGLEAVVDGGPADKGIESTVVKCTDSELEILRLGSISVEDLKIVVGNNIAVRIRPSGSGALEEAPGQLSSHYAPQKKLYYVGHETLLEDLKIMRFPPTPSVHVLFCTSEDEARSRKTLESIFQLQEIRVLSQDNRSEEAAQNLFKYLRYLDRHSGAPIILALGAESENHLFPAIRDRLKRASVKERKDG